RCSKENDMTKFMLAAASALAIAAAPAQAQLLGSAGGTVNGALNGTLGGAVNGTLGNLGSINPTDCLCGAVGQLTNGVGGTGSIASGRGQLLKANGNGSGSANGSANANAHGKKAGVNGSASTNGSGNGALSLGNGGLSLASVRMINGVPCGPDGTPLTNMQLASLGLTPTGAPVAGPANGSSSDNGSARSHGNARGARGDSARDPRSPKVPGSDRGDKNSGY